MKRNQFLKILGVGILIPHIGKTALIKEKQLIHNMNS